WRDDRHRRLQRDEVRREARHGRRLPGGLRSQLPGRAAAELRVPEGPPSGRGQRARECRAGAHAGGGRERATAGRHRQQCRRDPLMTSTKWPKVLPELTPEQVRVRDDFMAHWHEVLANRYGAIERFIPGWPAT